MTLLEISCPLPNIIWSLNITKWSALAPNEFTVDDMIVDFFDIDDIVETKMIVLKTDIFFFDRDIADVCCYHLYVNIVDRAESYEGDNWA